MTGLHKVKHYVLVAATVACLTVVLYSTSMAQEGLRRQSEELAAIAEQVSPAVVSISVEKRRADLQEQFPEDLFFKEFFGKHILPYRKEEKISVGMGTGIVMDKEGHIVTASHVVDDSRGDIKVKLADGRDFKAELIGADPDSGVAVIKIDAEDLTPARPGNSDDVRTGEWVLAFGNLHHKGITVTMGIVSATGRKDLGITTYEDFIQTDAMIGPGSGGGPLVNASGEVVGMIIAIHTEGAGSMGPGYAVPINTVLEVMGDLVDKGEVSRGWLGVNIQEVSAELAEKMGMEGPRGALVAELGEDSPAEEGGIEAGDVITEFDGKTIQSVSHLRSTVAHTEPGREVTVTVMRKGEEKKLTVSIGERTQKSPAALRGRRAAPEEVGWTGIITQELTPELAREFGYKGEKGVLISDVRRDSPADKKGLRSGDLIQEVDHEPISSMRDYEKAMKAAGDSILLRIKRGDRVWYEVIKAEDK
jgi:serine protease Do